MNCAGPVLDTTERGSAGSLTATLIGPRGTARRCERVGPSSSPPCFVPFEYDAVLINHGWLGARSRKYDPLLKLRGARRYGTTSRSRRLPTDDRPHGARMLRAVARDPQRPRLMSESPNWPTSNKPLLLAHQFGPIDRTAIELNSRSINTMHFGRRGSTAR